ncbi:MAG TPA: CRISPR-associated protein Cas4 [Anaerolineaceae bacterium]|nr:CRISPR-associated protein Cas4 [Anaerolineaceae bacterium]
MLYLALALGLLAILLFWQAARQRKSTGLPGGRVIYSDTRGWGPVEEPLYDARLGLAGKPDYLVRQGEQVIPVEVKTGRTPSSPHDAHIFQLAAYCYLVERTRGVRPPYGILHYPQRTFAIDYTPALEKAFIDLIAEMRAAERRGEADRSHEAPSRCARCGYRSKCDQRI